MQCPSLRRWQERVSTLSLLGRAEGCHFLCMCATLSNTIEWSTAHSLTLDLYFKITLRCNPEIYRQEAFIYSADLFVYELMIDKKQTKYSVALAQNVCKSLENSWRGCEQSTCLHTDNVCFARVQDAQMFYHITISGAPFV